MTFFFIFVVNKKTRQDKENLVCLHDIGFIDNLQEKELEETADGP